MTGEDLIPDCDVSRIAIARSMVRIGNLVRRAKAEYRDEHYETAVRHLDVAMAIARTVYDQCGVRLTLKLSED